MISKKDREYIKRIVYEHFHGTDRYYYVYWICQGKKGRLTVTAHTKEEAIKTVKKLNRYNKLGKCHSYTARVADVRHVGI